MQNVKECIALIFEVSSLPFKGECIDREKHSLVKELNVFRDNGEIIEKYYNGILCKSLNKPWYRMVLPIMH